MKGHSSKEVKTDDSVTVYKRVKAKAEKRSRNLTSWPPYIEFQNVSKLTTFD